MANGTSSGSFAGLTSSSYTIPSAGTYTLQGTLTLPTETEGSPANSQAVVAITQNGVNKLTTLAGQEGFLLELVCALGDVLAVSVSSSAAVDQPINAIRTTLSIY